MKQGLMVGLSLVIVSGLTALVVYFTQGIPVPVDTYKSGSRDGRTIYLEACAKCHGLTGEGTALAPTLKARNVNPNRIRERIQAGTGRMPKFPNIEGEALERLIKFTNKL